MKKFISFAILGLSVSSYSKSETKLAAAKQEVIIDGSNTVFLITEAIAEEFSQVDRKTRVKVGVSGTGGGFKKLINNDKNNRIDICDASRKITAKESADLHKQNIEVLELPIAYDALTVSVNPKVTFIDAISLADLQKIWDKGSSVKNWSDVNPKWPKQPIALFGGSTDSGTFDFFTEKVNKEAKKSRSDYTATDDYNTLVKGIAGTDFALGYFSHGYYEANKEKLKALSIINERGEKIAPTKENVLNHSYPLSRTLYIYVNKASLQNKSVHDFVEFYLNKAPEAAEVVKYIALTKEEMAESKNRFNQKIAGASAPTAK